MLLSIRDIPIFNFFHFIPEGLEYLSDGAFTNEVFLYGTVRMYDIVIAPALFNLRQITGIGKVVNYDIDASYTHVGHLGDVLSGAIGIPGYIRQDNPIVGKKRPLLIFHRFTLLLTLFSVLYFNRLFSTL
jgi:hypothetical protein